MNKKIIFFVFLLIFSTSLLFAQDIINTIDTQDLYKPEIIAGIYSQNNNTYALNKVIDYNNNNILPIVTNTDSTYYFYPENTCDKELKNRKIGFGESHNLEYISCGEINSNKKEIKTYLQTQFLNYDSSHTIENISQPYYLLKNISQKFILENNPKLEGTDAVFYIDNDFWEDDIFYYIVKEKNTEEEIAKDTNKEYDFQLLNIFCLQEGLELKKNLVYSTKQLKDQGYTNCSIDGRFCTKDELIEYLKKESLTKYNEKEYKNIIINKNMVEKYNLKGIYDRIITINTENQYLNNLKDDIFIKLYANKDINNEYDCVKQGGLFQKEIELCTSFRALPNFKEIKALDYYDNSYLAKYLIEQYSSGLFLVLLLPDIYQKEEFLQSIKIISNYTIDKPSIALIKILYTNPIIKIEIVDIINDKLKDKSFENDPYTYIPHYKNTLTEPDKYNVNNKHYILNNYYTNRFSISNNRLIINYDNFEDIPYILPNFLNRIGTFFCHDVNNKTFYKYNTKEIVLDTINIELNHDTKFTKEIKSNCNFKVTNNPLKGDYTIELESCKKNTDLYIISSNDTTPKRLIDKMTFNDNEIYLYELENNIESKSNKVKNIFRINYKAYTPTSEKEYKIEIINGTTFEYYEDIPIHFFYKILEIVNNYHMAKVKKITIYNITAPIGAFYPNSNRIEISSDGLYSEDSLKLTLTHELSHKYFQNYTDYGRKNPEKFKTLRELFNKIKQNINILNTVTEQTYKGEEVGHPYDNENELFASTTTIIKLFPEELIEKYNKLSKDDQLLLKELIEFIVDCYYSSDDYVQGFIPREILDFVYD